MQPSTRKLVGTLILFVFLVAYVLLAMLVAIVLQVHQVGAGVTLLYHLVTGLLWVLPAGYIIYWMQRGSGVSPDASAPHKAADRAAGRASRR